MTNPSSNQPSGTDRVDEIDGGAVVGEGADGQTAAREELRVARGERSPGSHREDGADLEQMAALGDIDDPPTGSLDGAP